MARKGTWFALIILSLVLALGIAVLGIIVYFSTEKPVADKSYLKVSVTAFREDPVTDPLAALFGGGRVTTFRDVLAAVARAADDDKVVGIYLDASGGLGFAQAQELRDALAAFREKSRKPVFAFSEDYSNSAYYTALAAQEVYLVPVGMVDLTGLRSETSFFRGLFDLLKMEPQFLQVAEYKNYADTFMRETMSDAHREATTAVLDDIYRQMVRAVAERWNIEEAQAAALIDNGPYWGTPAKDAGLVTDLLYWDEFRAKLIAHAGKDPASDDLETVDVGRYMRKHKEKGKHKIAVVVADGGITSGSSQENFFGKTMGSDTIAGALRDIRDDDDVKGVLLRVNSPGGSALASDIIWRETQLLREKGVPVVVSMGDVAGSGGYYISMGCDAIVAQPATITGSIGVVMGKIVEYGLWKEHLKVHHEVIKRGENADIYSSMVPFSDAQRKKAEDEMWSFYWTFVDKVAQGRHKTRDDIHAIAKGRIWTGQRAMEIGLVDALGGYEKALSILREKAGLAADAPVRIIVHPRGQSLRERLGNILTPAPPLTFRDLTDLERHMPMLREPFLLLTPIGEIK